MKETKKKGVKQITRCVLVTVGQKSERYFLIENYQRKKNEEKEKCCVSELPVGVKTLIRLWKDIHDETIR